MNPFPRAVTPLVAADVLVLLDGDLGTTAGEAGALVAPVLSGDADLVNRIDTEGYDWIAKETGVNIIKEETVRPVVGSIGACAANEPRGPKNA